MTINVYLFWATLVFKIIGSNAVGKLIIYHSSDSLKFLGDTQTQECVLKEVFSASLGLSVAENQEWDGFRIVDPFNTPEAVVQVHIDGVADLFEDGHAFVKKYPLILDAAEHDIYSEMAFRIQQHQSDQGTSNLVHISLSSRADLLKHEPIFGKLRIPGVRGSPVGNKFLNEIMTLKAITQKIQEGVVKPDNVVDFFYFRFSPLPLVGRRHMEDPNYRQIPIKEVKVHLTNAIQELSRAFERAYKGSVVVTLTTDEAHHRRSIRAIWDIVPQIVQGISGHMSAKAPKNMEMTALRSDDAGQGTDVVMFNLIFWFCIAYMFSVVAIVYAAMDMDPGKDTIIYRMTTMRTKKEL